MTKSPLLSIKSLTKRFDQREVLSGFDADLLPKENLVIMGKSGEGKSVLIKCIVGLMQPDSGSILLNGEELLGIKRQEINKVRQKFGFLFQSGAIYDSMTVKENIEFPLRRLNLKLSQNEISQKVESALTDVGLLHTINQMPSTLSGGMRKRVALARTIVLNPDIILYDEPTTGLDVVTGREIIYLINSIRDKYGTSSIIITHDLDCVRINSDRIILIKNGRSYINGTYENFLTSSDKFVQQFFN